MSVGLIAGVALFTAMGALLLRQYQPVYGLVLAAAGGTVLFLAALGALNNVYGDMQNTLEQMGLNREILQVLLKTLGICLLTQFGADLCRDAGETALAGQVELAGKLMALAAALPLIRQVAGAVTALVRP